MRKGMAPSVPARRPHDERADALSTAVIGELVGERGQLAHLEHVVDRHRGRAEALGRDGLDRVRGGRDLLLAQIEAREHDGLTVETLRDVDASVVHGSTVSGANRAGLTICYPVGQDAYPL